MLSREILRMAQHLDEEIRISIPEEVQLEIRYLAVFYGWHKSVLTLEKRIEELEVALSENAKGGFRVVPLNENANARINTNPAPTFGKKHHGFRKLECVVNNDAVGKQ